MESDNISAEAAKLKVSLNDGQLRQLDSLPDDRQAKVLRLVTSLGVSFDDAIAPELVDRQPDEKHSPEPDTAALRLLDVALLDSHPDNPRMQNDTAIIEALSAAMAADGFAQEHAILVRPKPDGRFEVISGHRRTEAARRAGIRQIHAWVRPMSDQEALERLAYSNCQEGLSKLEIAMHSWKVQPASGKQGGGLKAFARRFGLQGSTLSRYRKGALVVQQLDPATCEKFLTGLHSRIEHLAAIHSARAERWPDLVAGCVEHGWTIAETKTAVDQQSGSDDRGDSDTDSEEDQEDGEDSEDDGEEREDESDGGEHGEEEEGGGDSQDDGGDGQDDGGDAEHGEDDHNEDTDDDEGDDGESADSDADEPPDPQAAEAAVQTLVRHLTAMARMDFGSAQAVLRKYAARCLRAMRAAQQ